MVDVAPLRYGVIFKKAFSKPHIFMAFVKDITGSPTIGIAIFKR